MTREQLAEFARTTWRYSRGDGSVITPMLQLQLGGRVRSSPHPNEHYWTLRNGNLCFLNPGGEVTTEFTQKELGLDGRRVLRGEFLSENGIVHLLTEVPRPGSLGMPSPPPKVAVLVRTHVTNEKLDDLISVLGDSGCFDVFVCADCTKTDLQFGAVPVLRHRAEDAALMGLPVIDEGNLLWHCGDYAFYFAYQEIPGYDYYIMIEYDVDLPDRTPLLIEGIINRLEFSTPSALDFVGCQCFQGTLTEGWGRTVAGFYPEAHLSLFPFVLLSRSAIEYLIAERRAERQASIAPGEVMFCEAFVPSALNAGGFRRADLNELIAGATDGTSFRINVGALGPMLLGQYRELPPSLKLLHPVYDEANFVEYYLRTARESGDRAILDALTGPASRLSLSPASRELIENCVAELPGAQLAVA